jgi:hypothetical protein
MVKAWPKPLVMSASWSVFGVCERCGAKDGRTCVDLRNPLMPILNPHPGRRQRGTRAK